MSDDLIKRSDAIGACAYETIECYEARKTIRNLPSADRPKGEWIVDILNYKSACSVCGANETDFIYGTEMWYGLGESRFCPNCGSRMFKTNENPLEGIDPKPIPTKKHTFVYRRGADDDKECHKPESTYYRAYCEERKEEAYCEGCEFWY